MAKPTDSRTFKNRVHYEIRDEIAYVSMARPEKFNGLDFAMMEALIAAASDLHKRKNIRAVILFGEGPHFCSGLDVAQVTKQPGKAMRRLFWRGLRKDNFFQRVCLGWRKVQVPVICVIQGACYGGGLQIALGCDFRFASPEAEFSVMEAKWGLVPDMSGLLTLRELMPIDQARRLAILAEVLPADRAAELNLVTEISDDPMQTAIDFAEQIKTRSPDSVAAAKALVNNTWNRSERYTLKQESWLQFKVLTGANQRIISQANINKTPASFKPRKFNF